MIIFQRSFSSRGFTVVELMVSAVIFPLLIMGLVNSFNALRQSYSKARQLNEMYAVLSACPEIDRALEFSTLTSSTNCYPNNTFQAENGYTSTTTYAPLLTVSDTSTLPTGDPLRTVPDSKIVDIKVAPPGGPASSELEYRLLITRNGIGQL